MFAKKCVTTKITQSRCWVMKTEISLLVCVLLTVPALRGECQSNPQYQQQLNEKAYQRFKELDAAQRQAQRREEIQWKILSLNSDVIQKSNAVQMILSSESSPYKIEQYHYRTNVALRLKDLVEAKKARAAETDPWRYFDGQPIFISADRRFNYHSGKIIQTTPEGILITEDVGFNVMRMAPDSTKTVFIKHYPDIKPDDSAVNFYAAEIGPYQYTSILGTTKVVDALDYGKPCPRPKNGAEIEATALRVTPEEEQKIRDDAAAADNQLATAKSDVEIAQKKLQDFLQEIKDEKEAPIKQARLEAQEKAAAAKLLALKSNQELAAKGDTYGLLRMGERYRDGDGVEKDLAKAKIYLQKAVDAGSPTAAEELSKLK